MIPLNISVNKSRYSVARKLGSGKNAKVYKAFDTANCHPVAIKIQYLAPKSEVGCERIYLEQFMTEVSSLILLGRSQKVVKLYNYEVKMDKKKAYAVLELGKTIPTFRNGIAAKEPQRSRLWLEMVNAVANVHKYNIIHADIKPQNFISTKSGMKLIDFAYAIKAPNQFSSIVNYYRGTTDYVSPEVLCHKPLGFYSTKCDIWGLGCILYEMAYGRSYLHKFNFRPKCDKENFIVYKTQKIHFPHLQNEYLYDIIRRCMQPSVHLRPTIDEILKHPYTNSAMHTYMLNTGKLII